MSFITKQELQAQEQTLRQAVEIALDLAQKAGATAEVGVTKVAGLSVSTRLEQTENIEFNKTARHNRNPKSEIISYSRFFI